MTSFASVGASAAWCRRVVERVSSRLTRREDMAERRVGRAVIS